MQRTSFGLRGQRFSPIVLLFAALSSAPAGALEHFATGFEPPIFTGAASGVALNGQQSFYLPAVGGGTHNVFTYAGNTLGIALNPTGGSHFAAGRNPGGINARSQRDVAIGAGLWNVATDLAVRPGSLPTAQFAASFTVRDNPGDGFLLALLAAWTNVATATSWEVHMQWSNAAGVFLSETLPAGFQNLQVNHWYRLRARFDFATNRVLSVALTDLTNGATVVAEFTDRYLFGGAAAAHQPFAFRLFTGGDAGVGNIAAFDNVSIGSGGSFVDVDGNGRFEPLADGLLMLRYAFAFRGAVLVNDAVGSGCTRCDAPSIEAYLASLQ
jgi:hypothetical protein